jgi:hypothetical protein
LANEALRRGDLVEVRSPAEVLATLDEDSAVGGLPFMPEMAAYCGRRFRVDRRTEKVCDTVNWSGSGRLPDAVMLADLRCDGGKHDGCQAECRLIWKESWLRKVSAEAPPSAPPSAADMAQLMARAMRGVNRSAPAASGGETIWRCQATDLPKATQRLGTFDPRPYVRELTCGNVSFGHFATVTARAAVEEPLRKFGLYPEVPLRGPAEKAPPSNEAPLNLKPGEWVQVRRKEEIAATLNNKGYNRGLWFDREMLAYCGQVFRVRQIVTHFIDDRTGKMVDLKTDAVTLDDVVCTGDRVLRRWFCPRLIYPYWRDSWLRRVDAPAAQIRRNAATDAS